MMLDRHVVNVFLVFIRVGACLMIVPGLSTARVPVRVRLYLALIMAMAIAPAIEAGEHPTDSELSQLIVTEFLAGLVLGSAARIFIEMLEFMGSAISNYIGMTWLSAGFDSGEPQSTVAVLLTVTGTLIVMLMEFPHYLVSAIVQSYNDIPMARVPNTATILRHFVGAMGAAFVVGIQISAPFVVYGLALNMMFGVLGKLVPQFPSFFISGPFIVLGGLALLYLVSGNLVQLLSSALSELVRS